MKEPLVARKNLLHELLTPTEIAQPCEFIEHDGKAFYQATCDLGLEGIVAKSKDGVYSPGRRSDAWQKIKRVSQYLNWLVALAESAYPLPGKALR